MYLINKRSAQIHLADCYGIKKNILGISVLAPPTILYLAREMTYLIIYKDMYDTNFEIANKKRKKKFIKPSGEVSNQIKLCFFLL